MFEKTTTGEWTVLGLSVIIAIAVTLAKPLESSSFGISFILSLIVLYIVYWVISKGHPKSQDWGIFLWIIVLVGIPLIILFLWAVVAAFIFGMAGGDSTYQLEQYSNNGISFNYPSSIPINSSASGYSNATYYQGTLQFDNPDHQLIGIIWFAKRNGLSQESIQNVFTVFSTAAKKSAPDLNMSPIQETTHSGETVYYIIGGGHDTSLEGKMAYDITAIWEDPPSQRDFIVTIVSYKSQDDAQSLFDGVLNSIECH